MIVAYQVIARGLTLRMFETQSSHVIELFLDAKMFNEPILLKDIAYVSLSFHTSIRVQRDGARVLGNPTPEHVQ